MYEFIEQITKAIQFLEKNKFTTIFIFLLINTFVLSPDGNEENYFLLAKQFFNPNWIPNSFTINEFPGARIFYQYITGFFLQIFSFEITVIFYRFFFCFLYADALNKLISRLNISIYTVIFSLQIALFIPSFFAGENIFVGAEPKHFAYVFVLYSLYYIIEEEKIKVLILICLASAFHILVGGWYFISYCLYLLMFKKDTIKKIILYGTLYLMFLSPLIYYLIKEILINASVSFNGVQADMIYAFYRNPHHLGIFKSLEYFYHEHFYGVITLFICIILLINIRKLVPIHLVNLIELNITIGVILMFNLIVAFFDKEGHFLKFYPFRMTALFSFLSYIVIIFFLINETHLKSIKKIFWLAIFCLMFIHIVVVNYKSFFTNTHRKDFEATTTFIKNNTPKQSVFFYHTNNDDYTLQFTRLTERERYVVFKFVPAGTNKIYEWYRRMMVADSIVKQPALIFNEQKKVPIDYYLSENEIDNPLFNLVYSNNHYNLYQLTK